MSAETVRAPRKAAAKSQDPDGAAAPLPVAVGQVEAFPFAPGRCAVHPHLQLVDHDTAGRRSYSWTPDRRLVLCPDPSHAPAAPAPRYGSAAGDQLDAYRCTWCGGRLYPEGSGWGISDRKVFCRPLCRLQAFRAAKRAQEEAPAHA